MNCKFCGKELPAQSTGRRPREYCHDAHRQAYFRQQRKTAVVQVPLVDHPLESRIIALEQMFAHMQQTLNASGQRIEELERALQETQDLLVKQQQNQRIDQEIEAFFTRNPGLQALVEREKTKMEAPSKEQKETKAEAATQTEPTYEGEWTITNALGQVVYHDQDSQRARRRLDTLSTNYRDKQWHLHPPHFTPSSGTETSITTNLPNTVHKRLRLSTGEIIDFLHDFTVPGLHGYECKATHKDVSAELTVYPYEHGGDYSLTRTRWGKISNVGREGPKQVRRAQYLLATLIDRTEVEMRKAGWVESGMRDDVSPPRPLYRKVDLGQ